MARVISVVMVVQYTRRKVNQRDQDYDVCMSLSSLGDDR